VDRSLKFGEDWIGDGYDDGLIVGVLARVEMREGGLWVVSDLGH